MIYEDHGISGKSIRRPALDKALKAIKPGDVLVIWKLDRLGRNLRHLVNLIYDLTSRGGGLKVIEGNGAEIDTSTANGRFIFGIFAALAEFERELISERTRAGIAAAKRKGVKVGMEPKLSNADKKKVVSLMKKGKSRLEIAEIFDVSPRTISRTVKGQSIFGKGRKPKLTQKDIRLAKKMIAKGKSQREIARILETTHTTLKRALTSHC